MDKRSRFLAELKSEAKALGLPFRTDARRGKGSHLIVSLGDKWTTVPDRDIDPVTARKISKALGLP